MTAPGDGMHACPRQGCATRVIPAHLACAEHWDPLTKQTRAAVYAAYRSRDPDRVTAVLTAAIEEMNR